MQLLSVQDLLSLHVYAVPLQLDESPPEHLSPYVQLLLSAHAVPAGLPVMEPVPDPVPQIVPVPAALQLYLPEFLQVPLPFEQAVPTL
jgi:hypothetical protein